jgi:hypothetical protein
VLAVLVAVQLLQQKEVTLYFQPLLQLAVAEAVALAIQLIRLVMAVLAVVVLLIYLQPKELVTKVVLVLLRVLMAQMGFQIQLLVEAVAVAVRLPLAQLLLVAE